MASTRQLVSIITRQRISSQVIKTCQRSIHSSVIRLNTNNNEHVKKNFAESLTDKFIGQVKRQGKNPRMAEPTRFVQIDALPTTATTEDVRKLAREAFSKGDKSIIESKETTLFMLIESTLKLTSILSCFLS
jgi:nitrogenase subunit NifH